MGPLAQPTGYAVALVACVVLGCAVVVALLVGRRSRRARDRQARLDAELARSRADVEALVHRVEELGREVVEARRSAAEVAAREADREYVITSLARLDGDEDDPRRGRLRLNALHAVHRPGPTVGKIVEARLVRALARTRAGAREGVGEAVNVGAGGGGHPGDGTGAGPAPVDGSPVRERAVDLVVRAVAVGHGVRRALSPEVLDRAAAEAHVARRRSRRERRRELRDARRLLRAVRVPAPQRSRGPGRGTDRTAPGRDEDAA